MRRGIQDKSYFYLAKPFASRTLVNKVLEALGGTPEERRVAPNPVV
jgi:hypothetical protein